MIRYCLFLWESFPSFLPLPSLHMLRSVLERSSSGGLRRAEMIRNWEAKNFHFHGEPVRFRSKSGRWMGLPLRHPNSLFTGEQGSRSSHRGSTSRGGEGGG